MSDQADTREFVREEWGLRFSIPEPLRLRHIEMYDRAREEAVNAGAQSQYSINWVAAQPLIVTWECSVLPDRAALSDLGELSGDVMQVVIIVGALVRQAVLEAMFVPKNSLSRRGTAP